MISKETIKAEIEKVPEDRLEELFEVVKIYSQKPSEANGSSLLSKLKRITIEGPSDFSENIDLYLSGEKSIG
jgi:hypothetical protein